MKLKLTPETHVRKDATGVVRQISHARQPYRSFSADKLTASDPTPITPRALAEQYIRDASVVFDFASTMTNNFAAAPSGTAGNAGVELRFQEEKALENAVTVAYSQTARGLPIWGAGVSVRIDGAQMAVMGSHNTTHYDIAIETPEGQPRYLPHSTDESALATLLNLSVAESVALKINATRALIFEFQKKTRFDPQIAAHDAGHNSGFTGGQLAPFPTLPLPEVSHSIEEGKHYVVTEVLFTLPLESWPALNWRAFIEPNTGSVLYLRALVSCAQGAVFLSDPVSLAGVLHSAATPVHVLDPLRAPVHLLGLVPPVGQSQHLHGDLVKLTDVQSPVITMPVTAPPYDFSYSANTEHFAGCSAYHHCDGFFRLLQGMGIDLNTYFNNTDFPVPVDPHANGGQVNAQCNGNIHGNGIGSVVFGVAKSGTKFGIAADVRVVIHEFGHGVLWDHVDSPNFGFAHSPGDSLAVILHDPESKAPDRFETFPFMKQSAGLSRRHDRKVEEGWAWGGNEDDTQYGSEQILSTTLFRVYRAAGGDSADLKEKKLASRYVSYLILKAVSFLQFTTDDPDVFVSALTEADATTRLFEGHPGGALSKVFRWSFEKQGLYQASGAPFPVSKAGQPPAVDIYIDDGRKGEYHPQDLKPDFRGDAEIWNRTTADSGTTNQAPVIGKTNFAYVRVRNRGLQTATEVRVRGFQSKNPAAAIWPTDWKPLAELPANDLAPGGEVIVGPFPWMPHSAGENLLFGASALGDPTNLETVTAGPIPNSRLVPLDNNTAQRAF